MDDKENTRENSKGEQRWIGRGKLASLDRGTEGVMVGHTGRGRGERES